MRRVAWCRGGREEGGGAAHPAVPHASRDVEGTGPSPPPFPPSLPLSHQQRVQGGLVKQDAVQGGGAVGQGEGQGGRIDLSEKRAGVRGRHRRDSRRARTHSERHCVERGGQGDRGWHGGAFPSSPPRPRPSPLSSHLALQQRPQLPRHEKGEPPPQQVVEGQHGGGRWGGTPPLSSGERKKERSVLKNFAAFMFSTPPGRSHTHATHTNTPHTRVSYQTGGDCLLGARCLKRGGQKEKKKTRTRGGQPKLLSLSLPPLFTPPSWPPAWPPRRTCP